MYMPHISAASKLEVRKNVLFIHLKMFYSYTGGKHKNMPDRFIHQINAPSSCEYLSQKFCCRQETWGYAKEKVKKMDAKMSGVLKTMGTKMAAMKKREIAPALANISSFNKRDIFQGA